MPDETVIAEMQRLEQLLAKEQNKSKRLNAVASQMLEVLNLVCLAGGNESPAIDALTDSFLTILQSIRRD